MINPEEIVIATIKDLKGIFFYYVCDSIDKRISGLSIVYDDNKKLDYDYTYKYYKDYVIQVLKVYQREKKNNKIILYNELTEQVVNSYDISKIEISNDIDKFNSNRIKLLSVNNYNIKDIEEYLKKIILSIMELETGNKDTVIKSINGMMNKYLIECITSLGKEIYVSLECLRKTSDNYSFKMYFSDIDLLRNIEGNLIINEDNIVIKWNNFDNTLNGECYYSFKDNICNEFIIDRFGNILYFGDDREVITEDKKINLCEFAESIGIKCNKIIPTVLDSYILSEDRKRKIEDNSYYKRKVAYVTFKDDYVGINYYYTEGIIKYEGSFIVPFMIERKDIKYIPFDINNEHYVLKEVINVPTNKMSGEYQKKMNMYAYYLMKVVDNKNLRMPIDIISEEKIEDIRLDNLTLVKEYVRTRKKEF